MKTATITFHAAHNYGSMLQAFALQQTLTALGVDNEIINLRTDSQKEFYPRPELNAHNAIVAGTVRKMQRRYDLFEQFLKNHLKLTKEIADPDELASLSNNYDLFIAGSDQIWNPQCHDFTFAYYLPFAGRKISYATSFGQHGKAVKEESERIRHELLEYDAVSVREQGSADIVKDLTGIEAEILPDPVALLDKEYWEELAGAAPVREKGYIFTYHPFPRHVFVGLSRRIGRKLHMSNVTSLVRPTLSGVVKNSGFCKELECGPLEFLNLVRHSSLVVSGSFHAVMFAIIFERPFFAINNGQDNRISHLLKVTGLEDRMIDQENLNSRLAGWQKIDFSKARKELERMRREGIDFLKRNCTL